MFLCFLRPLCISWELFKPNCTPWDCCWPCVQSSDGCLQQELVTRRECQKNYCLSTIVYVALKPCGSLGVFYWLIYTEVRTGNPVPVPCLSNVVAWSLKKAVCQICNGMKILFHDYNDTNYHSYQCYYILLLSQCY